MDGLAWLPAAEAVGLAITLAAVFWLGAILRRRRGKEDTSCLLDPGPRRMSESGDARRQEQRR